MWIIDMGSGNGKGNDLAYQKRAVDSLHPLLERGDVVLKWQLFRTSRLNTPLDRNIWNSISAIARDMGWVVTSSVADMSSLKYLKLDNPPFVKIPCRPDLYFLTQYTGYIPVVMSVPNDIYWQLYHRTHAVLCCVRKYPAVDNDYWANFESKQMRQGLSDHTTGWSLYDLIRPDIYECHLRMPDSTGPDAGPWARLPEEIIERSKK